MNRAIKLIIEYQQQKIISQCNIYDLGLLQIQDEALCDNGNGWKQQSTNCLSVFHQFVGLALKGLNTFL